MKKIIFNILIISALTIFTGIFYLNEVVLPTKIRVSIVKEIEETTQKKVLLESVKFNIFKGLVLRKLIIYDDAKITLNSQEISCAPLTLPFLGKRFIISAVRLESPKIYVERRPDNTIDVIDLFFKFIQNHKDGPRLIIRKVIIKNARISFSDNTLSPKFNKEIDSLDMYLYLSPPAKLRFDLEFEIPSEAPISVDSSGEYDILQKTLSVKIAVKDLSCKEFSRYYENAGLSIPEGRIDCFSTLKYERDILNADMNGKAKGLVFSKDAIIAKLDSDMKANFYYDLKDKQFNYSCTFNIHNLNISGIRYIDRVDDIRGSLEFNNSNWSSDNLHASIFGQAVSGRVNLANLTTPLLDVYLDSDIALSDLQMILKERFNIILPAAFEGKSNLHLALQYKIPLTDSPQVKGSLDMHNATIRIEKDSPAVENFNGEIKFTSNQLMWAGIGFKYRGVDYNTSGTLTNFENPGVQMKLSSSQIDVEAVFALSDRLFKFSKLAGKYLDSDFSLTGDIDLANPSNIYADVTGTLDADISYVKTLFKKHEDKWKKIKPSGRVHTEFSLKGRLSDLKSCTIDGKLFSNSLSMYDLKPVNLIMDYSQANGIGDIRRLHSFLYGGTIDAVGRIDLASEGLPYWFDTSIQGVRIEKLKQDTIFRDNDIAGAIEAKTKINGLFNDPSKLEGSGKIVISDGKLWQLNLFKGLGVLLFTSDFNEVIFSDGSCNFVIGDRAIFTDDLKLKSRLLELYGSVKIDFQKAIRALLKAEFTEESLKSGVAKNIATVEKYSVIEIGGTLKEPKYKIKPDIGGIMEEIKDRFL